MQNEIKQHDEDAKNQLHEAQRDNAIELTLRDANVRDSKAVLPFLDKDTIKLEGGKLKGINEQIESIKADHDYLFNSDEPAQPSGPSSHPTVGGDRTGGSNDVATPSQEAADLNKFRII